MTTWVAAHAGACLLLLGQSVLAGEAHVIEGIDSTKLSEVVCDTRRDLVFVGDTTGQAVHVIDGNTEAVETVNMPGQVSALALSRDATLLAVGQNDGGLTVFYLGKGPIDGLANLESAYFTPSTGEIHSMAFDRSNRLLLGVGFVLLFDIHAGQVIACFGENGGTSIGFYKPLLATNAQGTQLLVAEPEISPGSLYVFDLSTEEVAYLGEDEHGSISGNTQELKSSDDGSLAFLGAGGENGVLVFDTHDITPQGVWNFGATAAGIDLSPRATLMYASVHGVYEFQDDEAFWAVDTSTGLAIQSYPLADGGLYLPEADYRGVSVSRDGTKAYVLFGKWYPPASHQVQVVETGYQEINQHPEVAAPTSVIGCPGLLVEVELDLSDPDGDAVTLQAFGLPSNAEILPNGSGYLLQWVPNAAQMTTVVLHASDGHLADIRSVALIAADAGGPDDCAGDLNDDGEVGPSDLAILLGAWGEPPCHPADFNGDGVVDAADLAQLLGAWGECE